MIIFVISSTFARGKAPCKHLWYKVDRISHSAAKGRYLVSIKIDYVIALVRFGRSGRDSNLFSSAFGENTSEFLQGMDKILASYF